MPFINDNVLDNGLAQLKAQADRIFMCSQEPATFLQASSTYKVGEKTLAAGGVFPSAIAAGSPSGRKLATVAVTDGVVTSAGTATHWSVATSGSSRLDVAQSLAASKAFALNDTWSMPSTDVRLAGMGG